MMFYLLFMFCLCVGLTASQDEKYKEFELPPFDGWYNNLIHPDWGGADTQLIRQSKVAYSDGVYQPSGKKRPNPLDISKAVHHGPAGLPSYVGRTALLVYFGQQIVEEIVDSQRPGCPIEYFNIDVSKDNTQFNPHKKDNVEMTFRRTRYDQTTGYSPNSPRQQLNEITPYIDGQVIYGPSKAWSDAIRSFRDGTMAGGLFPPNNSIRLPYANPPVPQEHVLKPVSRFQRIGNPRGHENPFLLSFGILWFRFHNLIALRLRNDHPDWNDEQIFYKARSRVIAQYQKIVFYDWLPVWLNTSVSKEEFRQRYPYYKIGEGHTMFNGYNPNIHPGISQEFQSAAMRFGHTLIPSGVWRMAENCELLRNRGKDTFKQFAALRLCTVFWDSRRFVEEDLDALFRGMIYTSAEREDSIMVSDVTDSLFGPLEFSRRDLAALNIQRGRDHGIPDYNSVRESYGLRRKVDFGDINLKYNDEALIRLRRLYGQTDTLDDIDLFTGGMLETMPTGPGELFHTIILDQFLRIRHGDRFWFENTKYSGITELERAEIFATDLIDIINVVTGVGPTQVPRNVFLKEDETECQYPPQPYLNGSYRGYDMLEPCTPLEHYDYFTGSEWTYPFTFFILALCIPITFLIMYLLAWRRQNSVAITRPLPPPLQRTASSDLNEFRVLEWIGPGKMERIVLVNLQRSENSIHVYSTQRVLLRHVDIISTGERNNKNFEIHVSSDKMENLLSLKLPEYDLVVKCFNREERDKMQGMVENFLKQCGMKTTARSLTESYILSNTVTIKIRQDKLNKFFKKILSMFNEGQTNVEENIYGDVYGNTDQSDSKELKRIELTQAEFGEAFGMKPNSTFVKHMFLLVDKDKSGRVSFKEFMDIFIQLSSDNVDSKVHLLFNMYDLSGQGYLGQEDIYNMVRSLLDLSENNVTEEKVREFTEAVYKSAGLRSGSHMTFTDFKRVFGSNEYAKTLKKATLELSDMDDDVPDQAAAHTAMSNRMLQRRATLYRGYSTGSGESSQEPELPRRHVTSPASPQYSSIASGVGSLGSGYRNRYMSMASNQYNTLTQGSIGRASRVKILTEVQNKRHEGLMEKYEEVVRYLGINRLQVFWVTLFITVTIGVFLERSMFYAFERENGGLRRIAGHGVTISRGSASGIMFTYAFLLLTMCKNTITILRETFLHFYIPFDSFHSMHKFVACVALFFTVLHVVAHGVNLYQICTQPSTDLNCYFREYFRASHELANFQYWTFTTMTGLTGVILTVLVIVLYIFALPYARRYLFHAFWNTHKLYLLIYIFMILHGSARLVQEPHFPYYLIGPAVLFTIDKLISMSRTKIKLTVLQADLLPSDVTAIKVKKPDGFEYKSGQWAQVSCAALGRTEFHPFTMTSAPHEKHVTFHIRAVGPWTNNLRRVFDPSHRIGKELPKLILDGPFGEGHQDWYRYEVSVLIGGGIGVTPFASILKDIVHRSSTSDIPLQCKKVYFLWVTRTQKQFEWVTDIIRDVEASDTSNYVTTHIFVTEIRTKFDLRTSMLYICERHFQKIAGKSLFTGLAATTHFGRPRFYHFLESLRFQHGSVKNIGVFSCGPGPMTQAVEKACSMLNRWKRPSYFHHCENF